MEENTNLKENFSILIPDGESKLVRSVVHCLSVVPGLRINILSKNRFSPIRFSRFINSYYYANDSIDELKISKIKSIALKTNSDIILPIDEEAIALLSQHKNELTEKVFLSPLPDLDAFKICSNKWLLSKFLKENKLPHPITINYKNVDLKKDTLDLQFPVLVKPIKGLFGKGIKLFDNYIELKSYLNNCKNLEKYILQSFINGFDIDCSVLCKEGEILQYTIQKEISTSNRRFGPPAAVEFLHDENVYKVVKELIKKLNWSGVAHIDLRYDTIDNEVKIIEVNPRFLGQFNWILECWD
ncbi:MAG: ATP-grasp domain-containing protein [Ignavibacteriales bacterium]|nr:ATP-grasp domain-containing protein [Ignavibacteriales bacterium]